ncbi:hypothetical protein BN59_03200 [Legionella massiliensis]|uniref:Uncharacterized protein n=1 Tax=Legionella massiliensis TaxID=1034943 RepID=A0A078KWQ2_9GAMM|nr:hypothetical protein [Legionella massiliensis]CDZ78885.1 hypothetical protein BN59_03200 [Legionella massiliensis]CEE14623.1 hypothetical protein BN1094_03200 [Legionella massiliensis]
MAKMNFKSSYITLIKVGETVRPIQVTDLEGNRFSSDTQQFKDSLKNGVDIPGLDPNDMHYVIENLASLGAIPEGMEKRTFATKERMLEILKYLSRLPEGTYVEVDKTYHSTTFRKLAGGGYLFLR